MEVMLGLATFFIVIIIAWLINYMLRFILEKRSRKFGIYLLLGMEKKQIAKLYMQTQAPPKMRLRREAYFLQA